MVFDFGMRLRQLRKAKNLSQAQLAKQLNMSKSVISGYENNTRTPSLDVLTNLAVFYNVTVDYLVNREYTQIIIADGLTDDEIAMINTIIDKFRVAHKLEQPLNSSTGN